MCEFQSLLTTERYDPPRQYSLAAFIKTHKDKQVVLTLSIYGSPAKSFSLVTLWSVHLLRALLHVCVAVVADSCSRASTCRYENPKRAEYAVGYNPSMDKGALAKQLDIAAPDLARGVKPLNRFSENSLAMPRAVALAGPAFDPATDPIYIHLHKYVCSGSQPGVDFFCDWLAFIVQMREKTGITPVLTGVHGAGKSV